MAGAATALIAHTNRSADADWITTLEPVSYCAAMDLALRYALCYSMIQ
jgi:hypothetical protein